MRGTTFLRYYFSNHTRYCILGGGTGGLNLSANMLKSGIHPKEIRIIEPA